MKIKAFGKTAIILKKEEYDELIREIMWLNSICSGHMKAMIFDTQGMKYWTDKAKEVYLNTLPERLQESIDQSNEAYGNCMKILEGR